MNRVSLPSFREIYISLTTTEKGRQSFIHPSLTVKKPRKKTVATDNKTRRFRPGTVALRDIKKYQKTSDCLFFAKSPFEKFVRDVVARNNDRETPMKISKNVFVILQHFLEQQLTNDLRNANAAAIHAGRVKVTPVDIEFIQNLRV